MIEKVDHIHLITEMEESRRYLSLWSWQPEQIRLECVTKHRLQWKQRKYISHTITWSSVHDSLQHGQIRPVLRQSLKTTKQFSAKKVEKNDPVHELSSWKNQICESQLFCVSKKHNANESKPVEKHQTNNLASKITPSCNFFLAYWMQTIKAVFLGMSTLQDFRCKDFCHEF